MTIKCIARPLNKSEKDLLIGNEKLTLRFTSDCPDVKDHCIQAPSSGWTHAELERTCVSYPLNNGAAYDVYLGKNWIGSSEV